MDYETPVSVRPYNKDILHHVKGYDGLISPQGDFYKVCERDSMEAVHDAFAEIFVYFKHDQDINKVYEDFQEQKHQYKTIRLAPKDILINLYGFVNYEYDKHGMVEITPPDPRYNNHKLNDKQFLMLTHLVNLNGDKMESLDKIFHNIYENNDYKKR